MNLSAPFIARPVATTLITIAIALAGVLGLETIPVSPLPQIDFPTILVQAVLPGASPETMASTVATPLERKLGLIAGVDEMTSVNSLGMTRISLQFDLHRDIDGAARDVQAAINAARAVLPPMPVNPKYWKVNPANAPVMILSLTSRSMTRGQMYDAASTVLAQRIAQVSGVGQVRINGSALPAVRIDVDIEKLARMGISLESVHAAVAAANVDSPKGIIETGGRSWLIGANDQTTTAAAYRRLIVAYRGDRPVRIGDVATVHDSVENIRNAGATNGRPSVLLLIYRQPGANILDTVGRVNALLPRLRASIPSAIDLNVDMDRTSTIRASLHEASRSLLLAVLLVILVVFAFLRSARAIWIPAVAIPVSLVGSFAAMKLLGYSLNNLTLMALAIATGFVVDDVIVVLENIVRHLEEIPGDLAEPGRSGTIPAGNAFALDRRRDAVRLAALRGVRKVGFTVLSMSLSLIAVFIPILAMDGLIGRIFREFAVTLSVSILISLAISLTTTPMLCAVLLRPGAAGADRARRPTSGAGGGSAIRGLRNAWIRVARSASNGTRAIGSRASIAYERSLDAALRHPRITLLILAATVAANISLYIAIPKGFLPAEDIGLIKGKVQGDQSISFQSMTRKLDRFMAIVQSDPAVARVNGFTGGDEANSGFVFAILKPFRERGEISPEAVIDRLRSRLAKVPGATLYLQPARDLHFGGRPSNAEYQYTLESDNLDDLQTWGARIRQALSRLPELVDVNSDAQDRGLGTAITVDRDSLSRLGLTMSQVDTTLDDAFGQRQVSTIFAPRNQYHVVEEADPRFLQDSASLVALNLIGPTGSPIPLQAFARWETRDAPLVVNHQGSFMATTISFNLAPGVSLGTAAAAIDRTMARIGVPATIHGGFQGTAKLFRNSLAAEPLLGLLALFAVYIVLGILYESLTHPITILSTLPSASIGAMLAMMVFRIPMTVIAFIGVILLIGIVMKNAIMMVDVAIDLERRDRLDPREAIRRACLHRLRPIMMTTTAALFGAMPLALGGGDGAELRRPLGIAIVGGLLFSQVLTLYTTPVVYLTLDRLRIRLLRLRHRDSGLSGGQRIPGL